MKLSYNWLKELVDLPWTPEETAEKLSSLGFPVEKILHTGVQASGIVAARILKIDQHPNADRLRLPTITDGTSEKTIVCGAPNIEVGQVVPLATIGAHLSGGLVITLSKIRGVESAGMLCSERELGLSEEHAGILQLPADTPLGSNVAELLGAPDTILEIEVTPNRPDVLNHIGIARDLAALANIPLRLPDDALSGGSENDFPITIEEQALCSRYLGRVLNDLKVGPSPRWLSRRLTDCGIRSINNVVDITNYVLLEWGHPLHAFDLAKMTGPEIKVRRAKKGEKFLALDEKTYELNEADLVIADREKAVCLAGVMGGQESGVTAKTTDIVLESAVFDRTAVRLTSRRLGLRSESSIRFEKGTDAGTALRAWTRAAKLISDLAGGKPGPSRDVFPAPAKPVTITLRRARLDALLGVSVPSETVTAVLTRLDFAPKAEGENWTCTTPYFRKDVTEEADIIEEVIRIVGYDSVPASLSRMRVSNLDDRYRPVPASRATDALRGFGVSETITSTFCPAELAAKFGVKDEALIKLANPLSQEESALRPNLSLNLLRAAQRNLNHQRETVMLFEAGRVFTPDENQKLGIVAAGASVRKGWNHPERFVDAYWIKGLVESVGRAAGVALTVEAGASGAHLHPHQSFLVKKSGKTVGQAGVLHPRLALSLDISTPCVLAEIDLTAFAGAAQAPVTALPKHPHVERDIAVVVAKSVTWASLQEEARTAAGALLTDIHPFDVFEGGSLTADQKSVAFRIRLHDASRTLGEADISGAVDRVKSALQKNCGAQLR